ncbi:DUF4148 domain-containing protein [Pandoraea sp. ISTKB]|uniref:DUF4148 domain-containing protein n=1 Tax=Pandoraea sp. ISTKB TaxID=1586708 RepID=UPI00084691D3|nr:DUF4148 domain-containing protein [Pandoraea sp. ISTKB]
MQKRLALYAAVGLMALMSTAARADHVYDDAKPFFAPAGDANRATPQTIQSDLNQAHAQGVPVPSNLKAIQSTQGASGKTRDEVYRELVEAQRLGLMNQPDSVYPRTSPAASPFTSRQAAN